jgi:hypothetical protein
LEPVHLAQLEQVQALELVLHQEVKLGQQVQPGLPGLPGQLVQLVPQVQLALQPVVLALQPEEPEA